MPGDDIGGLGGNEGSVGYGAGVGWMSLSALAPRLLLVAGHIASLLASQGLIRFKQGYYKAL